MPMPKWARTAVALWAVFQVAACSSSPTDAVQKNDDGVKVNSVSELRPGQMARIAGSRLNELTNLTVDGRNVSFRVLSPGEAEFQVPEMRDCETPGRRVDVIANGKAKRHGVVQVDDVLRLEVAESRVLSAEELKCLQIAPGSEEYFLSLGSMDRSTEMGPLATIYALGTSGVELGGAAASARAARPDFGTHPGAHTEAARWAASAASAAVSNEPFDDYMNAKVGDRLRFVNWNTAGAYTATSKEDVPFYEAEVVAVTDGQIVVADLRSSRADEAIEQRAMYRQAAETADRYMLSALRETIRPDVSIPGGKVVHVLKNLSLGGRPSMRDLAGLRWSSNVYVTEIDITTVNTPDLIASLMIHEAAHVAEAELLLRDPLNEAASHGWFVEAIATNAEDYAHRLALGSVEGAPATDAFKSGARLGDLSSSVSDAPSTVSPFLMGEPDAGAYDRGARILRYAGEQAGGIPVLYERLRAKSPSGPSDADNPDPWVEAWSIDRIAEEIGMTAEQLLAEGMLSELTDDLVPADVAALRNLPQLAAWDHSGESAGERVKDALPRDQSRVATTSIVGGGYAAWHIPGQAGHGISLKAGNLPDTYQARLTRIR